MFTYDGQLAYSDGKYNYRVGDLLGDRIKELRRSAGLSQADLAERCSVSREAVSQWESGATKNLRNPNLVKVAKAFAMTLDELVSGTQPLRVADESPDYQRQPGDITAEELTLLEQYRELSPTDRQRLRKILAAFGLDVNDDTDNHTMPPRSPA